MILKVSVLQSQGWHQPPSDDIGEFLGFDLHRCLAMVEVLAGTGIVSQQEASSDVSIDAMDDGKFVRCDEPFRRSWDGLHSGLYTVRWE